MGTVAVAVKKSSRCYIGFDIDDNYVNIIKKNKLNSVESNSRIGSSGLSFYLDKKR